MQQERVSKHANGRRSALANRKAAEESRVKSRAWWVKYRLKMIARKGGNDE